MPDKAIQWELPFYKTKVINTHFLAQANLETPTQFLRRELMNPLLKTSNSLSIIHWGVYLKGLAESWRIIIRKTHLCCFPTIIFRNTTNLKTFVCQAWDWAKHQHIRAGKKELKCSSRKEKAPDELLQYWGITTSTLSGWKQPQVLCNYTQAGVGQPEPQWMLSLEWTAEYEISGTRMQQQSLHLWRSVPATPLKGAKVTSPVPLQHWQAQEAQSSQSTCERDSQAQQNTKLLYYSNSTNSKNSILK